MGHASESIPLATTEEIARMNDASALARIDDLRSEARRALEAGQEGHACTLLRNACEISESLYIGADALAEYADTLEGIGAQEHADAWRSRHQELSEMLGQFGLPFPGYEDRLRSERAASQRRLGPVVADTVALEGNVPETAGPRMPPPLEAERNG